MKQNLSKLSPSFHYCQLKRIANQTCIAIRPPAITTQMIASDSNDFLLQD